jgi:phosphate ABC transporter permease protein PstC
VSTASFGRRLPDILLRNGALLALTGGIAILALVIGFVIHESRIPPSETIGLADFLLFERWDPSGDPPLLGIGHAWMATLVVVGLAVGMAAPLAIIIGIFLAEIAPPAVRNIGEPVLQLLAGIPAVVYGFVGYATLVPFLEQWLPTGETLFCAAIVLALMVLPYIAATAAESFALVAGDLRLSGLAMGVSRWYTFTRITLRKAAPGVLAGLILGVGRGMGEALAVLMLAGNSPIFPDGLFSRGQPITALIATDLGEAAINSDRYHALFSAGLLLMAMVIVINSLVIWLKRSLNRHERH